MTLVRVAASSAATSKTSVVATCSAVEEGFGSPDSSRSVVIGDVKDKSDNDFDFNSTVIGMKNKNYSTDFRPGMGLREERKTREEIMKGEERKMWQD